MIEVEIAGRGTRRIEHLVLDVNGTIACDGELLDGVADLLAFLRERLQVHLITADTHGRQADIDRALGMTAVLIPAEGQVQAKLDYIRRLGPATVAAVGNGANDAAMVANAELGIAVLGPEGAAVETLLGASVATRSITEALELLAHPKRLAATLRR
ncbi:MAG: HAD family hydrolase [Acidobacteria bacterium]|nr:HAD family hydrolase [Acidobacteriota bacterium]